MYCEKCGQQLPDHAVFCGKCGARISEEQNNFQVQEEKPVRTATNNSVGIRRSIIGICLLVGVIIVGGFFFLRRNGEGIQNGNGDSESNVVQGNEADEVVHEVHEVDIVTFGSYEQDNDLSNGAEPLEWIVLDQQDGKALLLSRYVIDCKPFHEYGDNITWPDCTLREWLNTTFFEAAFDAEERQRVMETEISDQVRSEMKTVKRGWFEEGMEINESGITTYDNVFLLSIEEVEQYIGKTEERTAKATAYALDRGVGGIAEGYAHWWLRSPGVFTNLGYLQAGYVGHYGDVYAHSSGNAVGDDDTGVRPAVWVNIEEWDNEIIQDVDEEPEIITFGSYEQDNDLSNGAEPLEWIVLDRQDGKVLLLSRYVIDYKQYHEWREYFTWKDCTLRKWLNTDFYASAFSNDEKKHIIKSSLVNQDDDELNMLGGETTYDNVFLLSLEDCNNYLDTNEKRTTKATAYALDMESMPSEGTDWLMRSPGYCYKSTSDGYARVERRLVTEEGVCRTGESYQQQEDGIRPAIWMSIEELDGETLSNIEEKQNESLIGDVSVGDIITFGTYEQDNDLSNGAEPLEWIVLRPGNGRALLLSRYVIDCKQYDNKEEWWCDTTWAECDLRDWLNTTFYRAAFDETERQQILEAEVLNLDNEECGTPGGETTYDKVFLLSLSEADEYFGTDEERAAKATAYTVDSDSWEYKGYNNDCAPWWLRSPGAESYLAAFVNRYEGTVNDYGYGVRDESFGVRPALWVSIDEWSW